MFKSKKTFHSVFFAETDNGVILATNRVKFTAKKFFLADDCIKNKKKTALKYQGIGKDATGGVPKYRQ